MLLNFKSKKKKKTKRYGHLHPLHYGLQCFALFFPFPFLVIEILL
jgi:hypothetical protein